MNTLKCAFILMITIISGFSTLCSSIDKVIPTNQEKEAVVIPPEAHKKAIQALKALGPTRGAKKIDYHMANVIGIAAKGIEAKSEKIKAALKDLGAKVTQTEVHIDLPGDVLFDFDKWDIRSDAVKTLEKVGEIIKAYKSPNVTIAGHTDSKGAEDYNLKLSEKRAASVKNWLVKNAGINADIIETVGYGESKPAAPNTKNDGSDNPKGRQKNRRVEILIKKK
jgi:photosystem I P700 chlorophyll a apoprotein A2